LFLDGEGWGAIAGQDAKWKVQKCGSAVGDSVVFRQRAPGGIFVRPCRHSCEQVSVKVKMQSAK
jgi:hypothetical protein